jgi:mRNA interferase RelE/StbE
MYKIEISSRALKEFNNLSEDIFQRIDKHIEQLKLNARPIGSIKLTDEEGFRIRVGRYRILYKIYDTDKKIIIYAIGHRKNIYNKKK